MTHDDVFLADIAADPGDDLPRMVYGDWLTDRGDPRGEFIHVQCLLARTGDTDGRRPDLEERERELLARHQDDWLGPLRPLVCRWVFRRGFLDAVAVPAAAYLRTPTLPLPPTVRHFEVDLAGFEVPPAIVEFVPESVARENDVLPIDVRGWTIVLAAKDAGDKAMLQKLEFIFNRPVQSVASPPDQIVEAIDRHYGQSTTESVDCISYGWTEAVIEALIDPDAAVDGVAAEQVRLTIADAIDLHADRIRVALQPDCVRLGYRIGLQWVERPPLPCHLFGPIVKRIEALAGIGPGSNEGERRTGRIEAGVGTPYPLDVDIGRGNEVDEVLLTFARPRSTPSRGGTM